MSSAAPNHQTEVNGEVRPLPRQDETSHPVVNAVKPSASYQGISLRNNLPDEQRHAPKSATGGRQSGDECRTDRGKMEDGHDVTSFSSAHPVHNVTPFSTADPVHNVTPFPSADPVHNITPFSTADPVHNVTPFPSADPVHNVTPFSTADPVHNVTPFPSADPVHNVTPFSTADPVHNVTPFPSADPVHNVTPFPTADPVHNVTPFSSADPVHNVTPFPTADPVHNVTPFPSAHPVHNVTPFPSAHPVHNVTPFPSADPVHNVTPFSRADPDPTENNGARHVIPDSSAARNNGSDDTDDDGDVENGQSASSYDKGKADTVQLIMGQEDLNSSTEDECAGYSTGDDHLENLTQSVLDLQGRAEAGADFSTGVYVHRRGIGRYSTALKSFLPVRPNPARHILPVSNLGCLNFTTFGWVTPIIIGVYRKGIQHLKDFRLSDADSAEMASERLERLWKKEVESKGLEGASFRLMMFKALRTRLIVTVIFLTLFVIFSLFNPIFLIRSFLSYLPSERFDMRIGIAYAGGMLVCELLRGFSLSCSWGINYHAGLRMRAGAMTLLYKKILNLKGLKDKSAGELVNLVANDGQRIFEAIAVGPLVLTGPLAMLVGTVYAYVYLGPWALVGCGIFISFYPFNAFISRLTTSLRQKCIFITDKRVRLMNELLSCVKLVKMYAWEKPFASKVAAVRKEERKVLETSGYVQSISTGVAVMVPSIAATLTFIAMVSANVDLTAAEAFSFVALLNAMRFVLGVLPYGVKALSEVFVALDRFGSVMKMEEIEPTIEKPSLPSIAVEMKDATLVWNNIPDVNQNNAADKKQKDSVNGNKESRKRNGEKIAMLVDEATNLVMDPEAKTENQATLNQISFTLTKGKLLGICGTVGSGKSSVIQAILGRMEKRSGQVCVSGKIAYVPQQAWIMNATVRDNILFGAPFNEAKYRKVVETCALESDFETFVSGDMTEIGERGLNLSGGQKQRVSLARALYSDCEVYLLDDPLSAVDIHVGRHIFTHCIKGALARKSVIFVTHQLQYLPQCDDIIFIKDGHILEHGDHDKLMTLGGEYATLMHIYYKEQTSEMAEDGDKDSVTIGAAAGGSSTNVAGLVDPGSTLSSVHHGEGDGKGRVILERALSVTSKISKTVEAVDCKESTAGNDGEKATTGRLTMPEENVKKGLTCQLMRDYMKASGGYIVTFVVFVICFLTVVAQNSSSMFLTYWLGQGSGNTTIQRGNDSVISQSVADHPKLSVFTLIYGMTVVAMVFFLLLKSIVFIKYTLKASSSLHDEVFAKIFRCPMSFFDTTPVGRIISRFSSDMDEIDVRLPMTAEVFIINVLHVLFAIGMISYVAPFFLIALIPLLGLFFLIFFLFTSTMRLIKGQDMISRAPLISLVTATVQGLSTIHAYRKERDFIKQYCELLNINSIPFVMFFIANRWMALRLDIICATVTSVTALIIVLTRDTMTTAMAGLALSSALQMTGLFQFTVRLAIETEARFTSVQRILDYSKTVKPEADAVISDKRPPSGWPAKGTLVYTNVQMRYREGLPLTLKGVSFKVNSQEKIGIVGRTGSGKSSLGVVLFRLVELCGGSIIIDDIDVSTLGLEDLRSKLFTIPQDPVLLVGTVRYNLDPFSQHTDDAIWAALEKCHIKDVITALEGKLESPVVENGENFSVGERQLLCMARALLRHSKILILDEATAAIDTETDALVQSTLKNAFWDCTMLIIAHRLNTVLSCDKILVMDDGKVVEFEQPSVLMAKSESMFRTMLKATEGSGLNS